MKLGQLVECNFEKHFSWKIILKMWWRNYSQTLFSKIKIEHFMHFVFIVCEVEDNRKWSKLNCRPLAFTSYKAFLKNKKRSGTSLPASFSAWFLKKYISVVILYYLTKFHCLVVFTSWDIVRCNCLLISLWRHEFWN